MQEKRTGRPLTGERAMTAAERKTAQRAREKEEVCAQAAHLAGLAGRLRAMAGGNSHVAELTAIAEAIDGSAAGRSPTAHVSAEHIQAAGAGLDEQARTLLERFAAILRRANGDQVARIAGRVGCLDAIMPAATR